MQKTLTKKERTSTDEVSSDPKHQPESEKQMMTPRHWDICVKTSDDGKLFLNVASCIQHGWIQSVSIPFSDFSRNLTDDTDLERFVANVIERHTILKIEENNINEKRS